MTRNTIARAKYLRSAPTSLVGLVIAMVGCVDPLPPIPTDGAARSDRTDATAPTDRPLDALIDVATDVATDASAELAADAPADAPSDASTDALNDAAMDAGSDATTDAATDAATDVTSDATRDASADVQITYTFVSAAFHTAPGGSVQLHAHIAWHGTLRGAASGIAFEGSIR